MCFETSQIRDNYNADNSEIRELKDKLEDVTRKIQKFEENILEKT